MVLINIYIYFFFSVRGISGRVLGVKLEQINKKTVKVRKLFEFISGICLSPMNDSYVHFRIKSRQ